MISSEKCNRYIFLSIGSISMHFAGIIYAWSILKVSPAMEYGWSNAQLSFNFTLVMCFFGIGGLIGGIFSRMIKPCVLLLTGAFLVVFGFVMFAVCRYSNIGSLYILYGVVISSGIGIIYNVTISILSAWFPDKKGLCSGVLLLCFGLSSLLLGNAAAHLIASELFGWRKTFALIGILSGVVFAAAAMVLKYPGSEENSSPDLPKVSSKDLSTKQMITRPLFWKFFLFAVTNVGVGIAIVGVSRDIAIEFNSTDALAIVLVGVLSMFNGLGRIISGILYDRLGRKKITLISGVLTILSPTLLMLAVKSGSVAVGIVGICVAGISYGCIPPIVPATIQEFYGRRHFASNFSVASLFLIPASFSSAITGAIASKAGSYISVFPFLILLALVSLALNISIIEVK